VPKVVEYFILQKGIWYFFELCKKKFRRDQLCFWEVIVKWGFNMEQSRKYQIIASL